jgi:hypothetical protein
VPSAEPVVLEVGSYTGPRLRAARNVCIGLAVVAILAGPVAGGVGLVVLLVVGVLLLVAAFAVQVAAKAARGSRLVVDRKGITWDAGDATWRARWSELSDVGLVVLRSRRRDRTTDGPGGERVIRILVAFRSDDPDADSEPLRRIRVTDEPAPWTHRMAIASRGDWAAELDEGLARFAGSRYAGIERRDAYGRAEGGSTPAG